MNALLCIDDTDNLESPGSGHILEELCRILESEGLCRSGRITRHQLFVHPDVPYTSHNSSMCIDLTDIEEPHALIRRGEELLRSMAAPGSDPGFCFALREMIDTAKAELLLSDFGRQAKVTVLTKALAMQAAESCGIYLSELGGTGDGIIGAVAGIGLRLSGNDGRFRGKFDPAEALTGEAQIPGSMRVQQLLAHPLIDQVGDMSENAAPGGYISVEPEEQIHWNAPVKTVLLDHRAVLPVKRDGEIWRALDKDEVKELFN